ncbi:MAG: hypothetical protein P4L53_13320 [Candidatus Obscuribacterales bacterium]|nr:hypothetical protein [Candidatus Obscuribacterales bacterium]
MADKVDPIECKMLENSKAAPNPKDVADPKSLSNQCFDLQMKEAANNLGKPSLGERLTMMDYAKTIDPRMKDALKDLGKPSLAEKLAVRADLHASESEPDGMTLRHVRNVLSQEGIKMNPDVHQAKNVDEIPGMTQLPEGSKIQAGDVVVTGPRLDSTKVDDPGNIGIAVGEGKMANNRISQIPDPKSVESFKVFRTTDSKS